jgi:hypothetical protein
VVEEMQALKPLETYKAVTEQAETFQLDQDYLHHKHMTMVVQAVAEAVAEMVKIITLTAMLVKHHMVVAVEKVLTTLLVVQVAVEQQLAEAVAEAVAVVAHTTEAVLAVAQAQQVELLFLKRRQYNETICMH